jgi:hypothetical protein
MTDDCCNVREFLISGHCYGLNEELVSTLGFWWGILFHRLEKDYRLVRSIL